MTPPIRAINETPGWASVGEIWAWLKSRRARSGFLKSASGPRRTTVKNARPRVSSSGMAFFNLPKRYAASAKTKRSAPEMRRE
jgi:hypothetical protein